MILISSQMTSTCLKMIWQKIFNFTLEKLHLSADGQSQSCQLSHQGGDLSDKLGTMAINATKTDQIWPSLNLSITILTSLHGTPSKWCSDVSRQQQQMQSEPSCTKGKALEAACRLGSFVGICSLGDLEKRAQIEQESVHVHTIYYILYIIYYILYTIY